MTDRELMQMVLDALEEITGWQSLAPGYVMEEADEAKNSLRKRLSQYESFDNSEQLINEGKN